MDESSYLNTKIILIPEGKISDYIDGLAGYYLLNQV